MMHQIEEQLRQGARRSDRYWPTGDRHGGEESSKKETRSDNDRDFPFKFRPRYIGSQRDQYGRHGYKLRLGVALLIRGEAVDLNCDDVS
jgi:hypothetical protein